jgi:hypothetical protein
MGLGPLKGVLSTALISLVQYLKINYRSNPKFSFAQATNRNGAET